MWGGRCIIRLMGRTRGIRALSRCSAQHCTKSSPSDGSEPKRSSKLMHSEFGKFGKFVLPPSDKLVFDEEGLHGRVHTTGMGMDILDRNGHMNPWKACRAAEYIHKCVVLDPRYALGEFTTRDRTSVVVTIEYNFHPALYARTGSHWVGRPLVLGQQLIDLGKTSFIVIFYIEDATTGVCLSRTLCKGVIIDYKSGRPIEIPIELRERLKPNFDEKVSPPTYRPQKLPEMAYSLELEVMPSDIDANMHLNNHSYPRLCWDAAAFAVHDGKFQNFKGDLLNYRPRKLNMAYLQAAKMGDLLVSKTWEDPDDPLTIHFQLNHDDKPILCSSLQYYTSDEVTEMNLQNKKY